MAENPQMNNLLNALGSMAEMAHIFYADMKKAGAGEKEALAGMAAYIQGFLMSTMQSFGKGDRDDA